MHYMEIKNFGPIKHCAMDIGADGSVTVLTGPQASGKSTVAKAVYFFRTVKDELLDILMTSYVEGETVKEQLAHCMCDKLIMMFDWSYFDDDMSLLYYYEASNNNAFVKINRVDKRDHDYSRKAMVVTFGLEIISMFNELEAAKTSPHVLPITDTTNSIAKIFRDDFVTVFIPAGRSSLLLLSDHLQYLLLEGWRRNSIDYSAREFVNLTVQLRPWFTFARALHEPYAHRQHILECINHLSQKTISSSYQYVDNEERLYFSPHDSTKQSKHVKIANASSGQQEAVWVFNILTHYLAEQKKVFLIIEEPEAHLYPESQMHMTDALSLFAGYGNSVMITTHSPYVLGEINNLLICGQVPESKREQAIDVIFGKGASVISVKVAITPDKMTAQHIVNGECKNALDDESLCLIMNELIDGASDIINGRCDKLLGLLDNEEES